MDSFFKIAAVDTDARCNNVTPFSYKEMDRKQDAKTGRVFTKNDVNQAWATFMKITNSTNSRAIPCCNPDIKLSDVNPELLAKVQGIYTYARPIVKNGDLVELQLTKTAKANEAGWEPITPYIICKLSYALQTPGVIKKSTDAADVWVVSKQGMLLDCFPTDCKDSTTVDNLFGTTRKDPEYTYIDDASVARAVKDGDVKYIRDYLFKYNNANQVLTHDDYGNRLVHLAAMNYRPKVFELLVAVKANFNVRNAQGNTPLHLAVKHGNMDCIEELVKLSGQTIEVNGKNTRGETPMMLAIAYKPKPNPKTGQISDEQKRLNMTMIRYLYNNGGNVLDRDAYANNMIHIILLSMPATREMSDAVKFMLNKGVPADQKNNAGITPLMLAADKLKATGFDNLLPPAQVIDSLDSQNASELVEGFASNPMADIDQILLPSATINAVNQSMPGQNPITTIPESPADNGQGVHEIDHNQLTAEQIELMEIRTMLFNDIIRNNPSKYGKFINVRDIPAGAPVEVLDHKCVSATGESLGSTIDTEEHCAQVGGNWVKITNPSTLVKLELLPESKRIIDRVPDHKLYYPKKRPSEDAVPLPSVIQELNASVRKQMNNGKQINNSSNLPQNSQNPQNATENSKQNGNQKIREGFHPLLLAGLFSGSHHLGASALGAVGGHMLGNTLDAAGEYISKAFTTEPPIDPDNLTSQRRPDITNSTQTNPTQTNSTQKSQPSTTTFSVTTLKAETNTHPPIQPITAIGKEEFTAMRMQMGKFTNWRLFFADNWMMLLAFCILAAVLIMYVSGRLGKTKT